MAFFVCAFSNYGITSFAGFPSEIYVRKILQASRRPGFRICNLQSNWKRIKIFTFKLTLENYQALLSWIVLFHILSQSFKSNCWNSHFYSFLHAWMPLMFGTISLIKSSDLTWCIYKAETRWGSGGGQGHRHRRWLLHLHGSQRKQRRLCVGLRHSGQRTQAGTLLQASSDPSSPIRKEWVQPRRVPRQDLLWSKQVWPLIQCFSVVFLPAEG